jgi:hypothetical protein
MSSGTSESSELCEGRALTGSAPRAEGAQALRPFAPGLRSACSGPAFHGCHVRRRSKIVQPAAGRRCTRTTYRYNSTWSKRTLYWRRHPFQRVSCRVRGSIRAPAFSTLLRGHLVDEPPLNVGSAVDHPTTGSDARRAGAFVPPCVESCPGPRVFLFHSPHVEPIGPIWMLCVV